MERRLSAVLIADVVGYSRLTQRDEEGTRARFNDLLGSIIRPALERYSGRLIKNMGDGLLIEFASVVNAMRTAIEIQKALAARNSALPEAERISFRIGANLGDIIVEGDDIQGNGVNIAARLQTLAEPGGVVVSRSVYDEVKDKLGIGFESLGLQQVKGIDKPIRAFRANLGATGIVRKDAAAGRKISRFPLAWAAVSAALFVLLAGGAALWLDPWTMRESVIPDARPSIIVLPFDNLSDDKEQGYLADGITEDITTELARIPGLFVISRSAAFGYKGKNPDPKLVSQDMGVRYVLEGSVRRAGNAMRINAQLIDGSNNGHLWAQRFDGEWQMVVALQDNVVRDVATALAIKLVKIDAPTGAAGNIQPADAFDGKTGNAEAYEAYLLGRSLAASNTPESLAAAVKSFERAIAADPQYGKAYAELARIAFKTGDPKAQSYLDEALKRPSATAYRVLAHDLMADQRYDEAATALDKAIALDPSDARNYRAIARVHRAAGRDAEAQHFMAEALKVDPKGGDEAF